MMRYQQCRYTKGNTPVHGEKGDRKAKKRRRAVGLFALALLIFWGAPSRPPLAAPPAVSEYELKAAFLYNFINFVSWPESAAEVSAPFVLAVFGNEPTVKAISRVLEGETIRSRPVKVRQALDAVQASSARLVFFTAAAPGQRKILQGLRDKPVITVGETPGFIQAGGMINFIKKDNKVRFEINPDTARSAGIKISSRLLKLAIIIQGPQSRQGILPAQLASRVPAAEIVTAASR